MRASGKRKVQPRRSRNFKICTSFFSDGIALSRELGQNSRRDNGASRFPSHLQRKCTLRRAHHRPGRAQGRGREHPVEPQEKLRQWLRTEGAASAAFGSRGPWSMIPGAQAWIPGHRGHRPGCCTPPGQAEAGRAQDSQDTPAGVAPSCVDLSPSPQEHPGQCTLRDCDSYCGS